MKAENLRLPDEDKIAYALDLLPGPEREALERDLAGSPADQEDVRDLKRIAAEWSGPTGEAKLRRLARSCLAEVGIAPARRTAQIVFSGKELRIVEGEGAGAFRLPKMADPRPDPANWGGKEIRDLHSTTAPLLAAKATGSEPMLRVELEPVLIGEVVALAEITLDDYDPVSVHVSLLLVKADDPSKPIAGRSVLLRHTGLGQTAKVTSLADGRIAFSPCAPGAYVVEIEAGGVFELSLLEPMQGLEETAT